MESYVQTTLFVAFMTITGHIDITSAVHTLRTKEELGLVKFKQLRKENKLQMRLHFCYIFYLSRAGIGLLDVSINVVQDVIGSRIAAVVDERRSDIIA